MKLIVCGLLLAIAGFVGSTLVEVPEPMVKARTAVAAVNGGEVEAAAARAVSPAFYKTAAFTRTLGVAGIVLVVIGVGMKLAVKTNPLKQ